MNRLPLAKREQIVSLLTEGNSLRSTTSIADVSINTVTKLLVDIGQACQKYHNENVKNFAAKRVQCDEVWSFVYAKDKNLPEAFRGMYGIGSIWTWVAMEADSKFAISWLIGNRDVEYARIFVRDVASRLKDRMQLTTDGLKVYLEAVEESLETDVDYAQLVKIFGKSIEDERRYNPHEYVGVEKNVISGNPTARHISTSRIEHQNLTMRMNMRRFTRLTNGFSKKVENHAHAVALHFMYHNFVRIHKSLRISPAMAAGFTNKLWSVADLINLIEEF